VQVVVEQEKHGGDKGQRGNHVENQRMAHEGNVALDSEKFHLEILLSSITS
jgi:hypothetical protein